MNTNNNLERGLGEPKAEVIIKLGMDVHATQITICRQVDGSLPQPAQRMDWTKALQWIKAQLGAGVKVHSCYEAGPCGYGLHRMLCALGITNVVVAPQCWDERRQRVKTDKRDARELVDRLDRYLRGNHRAFAVVRVPTPEQEQQRAVARHRGTLLAERNRCILRGFGLMLGQGVNAPGGWWQPRQWVEWSAALPTWLREAVGLWQRKALEYEAAIAPVEAAVRASSAGQTLVKGMGTLTTAILQGEILDWTRFRNRRQVASYTGLCPSEKSSGESRQQGAINKHGNPRVRHQLIEAVWRLEQWQPEYPPIRKLRAAAGKRARKRAAVAAARRLAVDLWRLATGQCSAQKLGLQLISQPQS